MTQSLKERLLERHVSHHGDGYTPPLRNPDGPAAVQEIKRWMFLTKELTDMLDTYVKRVPLGHQPHMKAHVAEALVEFSRAALLKSQDQNDG